MDSILIGDDEPQIRKLLSRMMELEGKEVSLMSKSCQRIKKSSANLYKKVTVTSNKLLVIEYFSLSLG